jgi:hypothetical protein
MKGATAPWTLVNLKFGGESQNLGDLKLAFSSAPQFQKSYS